MADIYNLCVMMALCMAQLSSYNFYIRDLRSAGGSPGELNLANRAIFSPGLRQSSY